MIGNSKITEYSDGRLPSVLTAEMANKLLYMIGNSKITECSDGRLPSVLTAEMAESYRASVF